MFKMLLFFLKIPHLWLFTPESWKWNHVLLKCFWRVWVQKACFHHVTVTCRINMSWRRSSPSLKMIPMVSLDKVVGSARLNCSHKGFFLDAITLHCSIYEQWQFHHQLRKLNKSEAKQSYFISNIVPVCFFWHLQMNKTCQTSVYSFMGVTRHVSATNTKTKKGLLRSTTYHQWPRSQARIIWHFKALRQTLHLQTLQFLAHLKNNCRVQND